MRKLIVIAILLLAGCESGSTTRGGPQKTFEKIYRACIEGQYAVAHRHYSSRMKQAVPVADIARIYGDPAVRETTRSMLAGATFKVSEVNLNHAFAEVRWPDGSVQKMTFVLEEGGWLLDITPVSRKP